MTHEELPRVLTEALALLSEHDAAEALKEYQGGSEGDRAGMLSFLESDGPEQFRQLRLSDDEGTPTAGDLEGWSA